MVSLSFVTVTVAVRTLGDRFDFVGLSIWDFDRELLRTRLFVNVCAISIHATNLFYSHDDFDGVKAVKPEVFRKRRLGRELAIRRV